MPDRRTHRGPHPEDIGLFAVECLPAIRQAAGDLAWLLDRGYAPQSSLKLVGDRFELAARQRAAIARSVCSEWSRRRRRAARVDPEEVAGHAIWIDGYNLLTTVEAALAGAVVLVGREGAARDMASMHGSFRKVMETRPALEHIGSTLAALRPAGCRWLLDQPVSNSGRLKQMILAAAGEHGWPWSVELVPNPDPILAESAEIVATADSAILDRCRRWLNLARRVIEEHVPGAWIIDPVGQRD